MTKKQPMTRKRKLNIIKTLTRVMSLEQSRVYNNGGMDIGSCDECGAFRAAWAEHSNRVNFNRYLAVKDRMPLWQRRSFMEIYRHRRVSA